jgi:hypothetical protein
MGRDEAEDSLAAINRQEGKADAVPQHELVANPQRVLLHGCSSM